MENDVDLGTIITKLSINFSLYCAAGVRLDGFLAESEGLSGDLGLRRFANNYQVSSVKSGSGQPPDRAQICS